MSAPDPTQPTPPYDQPVEGGDLPEADEGAEKRDTGRPAPVTEDDERE
jgi:hypothetical protein